MPFLSIVLGFAFLIFIHELGHFLVARWCGIRCPQFAVGFGQAVLAWRKGMGVRVGTTEADYADRAFAELEKTRGPLDAQARAKTDIADLHKAADSLGLGQTEYRLNWIPLGGYVKMVGQEDMDPNSKSKDPAAFSNKSAKARAAVLVAGVVMNLITGLVFLVIAFTGGVEFPAATVGHVAHGSPAEKGGLQVGDQITGIDGKKVTDFFDLKMSVVLADGNTPLALEILRDGKPLTLPMTPQYNKAQGMQTLGMAPSFTLNLADPTKLKADEMKEWQAGTFGAVKSADAKIISLNGQPVADFAALHQALQQAGGRPCDIGVKTASGTQTIQCLPEMDRSLFATKKEGKDEIFSPLGLTPLTRIEAVNNNSPAATAGLRVDDIVLAVGNQEYPTNSEFQTLVTQAGNAGVAITVERDGKKLPPMQLAPRANGKLGFLGLGEKTIGVSLGHATNDSRFIVDGEVQPALKLNLPRGSRLISLAGEPVMNWNAIQRVLTAHQAKTSVAAVIAPNIGLAPLPEPHTLNLTPALRALLPHTAFHLPSDTPLLADKTIVRGTNPLDSARIGCIKTRDAVVQTYITIARLVQGKVGSENINGVVGIVAGGAKVAETGDVMRMLYLLGIISINLAVMNLLPIPVLDGGHLVFLVYEKITGKPLPEKVQTIAFIIGLTLLGSLMLYATWNDLVRLFG